MTSHKRPLLLTLLSAIWLYAGLAQAHCEVPCGIYDDDARIAEIAEHITTLEKAMGKIKGLQSAQTPNANQQVRWINAKDDHAEKLQRIVSQYFLTQRVKPVKTSDAGRGTYLEKISVLHEMLVSAMKCKQSLDVAHIAKLRSLLEKYAHLNGLKHP